MTKAIITGTELEWRGCVQRTHMHIFQKAYQSKLGLSDFQQERAERYQRNTWNISTDLVLKTRTNGKLKELDRLSSWHTVTVAVSSEKKKRPHRTTGCQSPDYKSGGHGSEAWDAVYYCVPG